MQRPVLYLSDPLAMHHILVKDVNTYDETDEFMTCVLDINIDRF